MRSLTRLIFAMALAAAAPAASLLVTTYGQDAAAKPGIALNGPAWMSDTAGVVDPSRLRLRHDPLAQWVSAMRPCQCLG